MAAGLLNRAGDLADLFNDVFERLRKIERATKLRVGSPGRADGGLLGQGWSISVRSSDGALIATADPTPEFPNGSTTVIAVRS